jgi:hypothetical protein
MSGLAALATRTFRRGRIRIFDHLPLRSVVLQSAIHSSEELGFACCFRVYYRWRTHRARSCPALSVLDRETLGSLLHPYGIRILEVSAGETDVRVLASLLPIETVAACAGKMKGRVSKWLRGRLGLPQARQLLRGDEASSARRQRWRPPVAGGSSKGGTQCMLRRSHSFLITYTWPSGPTPARRMRGCKHPP